MCGQGRTQSLLSECLHRRPLPPRPQSDRKRTSTNRKTRPGGLFPDRLGHRRILPIPKHSRARPRIGRQQRRLLCARDHGSRCSRHGTALRALSIGRARRVAGYRSRPSQRRSARARHPTCLSALRQARRSHDSECHHLSRPLCHPRHRKSARLHRTRSRTHRSARSLLGLDRSQGHRGAPVSRSRLLARKSTHLKIPGSLSRHSGPAAPSRPTFRRHGDLRRPARFHRSTRTRHHARTSSHPVGQRRLRRHGHHQSGSAGPRHDGRARRFHPSNSRLLSPRK